MFSGLALILLFLLVPAFAEESTHSTNIIPHTNATNLNDTNATNLNDVKSSLTITTEWNVGIFAIIGSAITFISILLTVRFVYIDKTHEKKIQEMKDGREKVLENEEKLVDDNKFTKNDIRRFGEYISGIDIAIEYITNYRKANSTNGIRFDVSCMAILFIVGVIATTGIFKDHFILLLIFVGILALVPVAHFTIQLRRTQYSKFSVNHY